MFSNRLGVLEENFETGSDSSEDERALFQKFLEQEDSGDSSDELEFPSYANPFELLNERNRIVSFPQHNHSPLFSTSVSPPSNKDMEQKASEQAAKVLKNAKQSRETKKKGKETSLRKKPQKDKESISTRKEAIKKPNGKRKEKLAQNAPWNTIQTPNTTEDADEALARELQNAWNAESQNEKTEWSDEMLARMLQDAEDAERRRRQEKEALRRKRERLALLQREMRRHFIRTLENPSYVDVDNMSYEELLALEERIGDVKSHGASKEELHSLPVTIVEENLPQEMTRCTICLSDFEKGDTLKTLPCFHKYHSDCIDQWLIKRKTCPVCQKPIVEDS